MFRIGPLAVSALILTCALAPLPPATAASAPVRLALSALGDLSPYRGIASDTLTLVDKGDIPAARARVKDLETAWDRAEATLKPADKATWTDLDAMIDAVLTDLRTPAPKPTACAASLRALIARIDGAERG